MGLPHCIVLQEISCAHDHNAATQHVQTTDAHAVLRCLEVASFPCYDASLWSPSSTQTVSRVLDWSSELVALAAKWRGVLPALDVTQNE